MKTTIKYLAILLAVLLIPIPATSVVVHGYFELKADSVEIYPGETAVFTIEAELYNGFYRDIQL